MSGPASDALIVAEEAMWRAARAQLDPAVWKPGALAAAIEARSRRYTSERELLDAPLVGRELAADVAARALFFTAADAGKLAVPLAELEGAGLLPSADPLRLLDLGAGCGAMAIGALALATARGVGLAVTAIDRDAQAMALMGDALPAAARALGVDLALDLRRETVALAPLAAAGYHLVTAGHLFNEIEEAAHLDLAVRMLAAVAPGGALVIVEPALRETTRALHRLRDAILERGLAHVVAPCTRAVAPCPMLADPRDWCHEDRPPALPPRAARLARETGLRDTSMKFAYLALAPGAAPADVAMPPGKRALRVVSHPAREKGKVECFVCGADGRTKLRLLRRHRGVANRGFERARRGDVVVVDAIAVAAGDLDAAGDVELRALRGGAGPGDDD